ncbi:MAG: membrane protein insertase YidC [Coriobacteriales bacterium]|jgi:YidC/Oxa1 family membrane protein insertase|nr:membrane protein insertase YidC [Coriobacteriales bacterium]
MEAINTIFGIPLGYVLYFCYNLLGNYGLAILLFTLLTKVILFPLSIIAQKNSIIMVKIQPALDEIKQRYAGNTTLILDEQKALYKREHYSMLKNVLPLLIQIPIILGLINVIYNPLQHLLHIDPATIQTLVAHTAVLLETTVDQLGAGAQLAVIELTQNDPQALAALPVDIAVLTQIRDVQMDFLGMDLAQVPWFNFPQIIYPVLSGLSAFVLCLFQNKYNVLQINQGFWGKWGTAIFLVAFSFYFALVLPCGVGLYWIAGNLLSIAVLAVCNLIYDPHKHIDFSALPQKTRLTRTERRAERVLKREKRVREQADEKRFFAATGKQLVFYSEASGYYKYFERLMAWLLAHSDVTIHYVTSDFNDRIFEHAHEPANPRIETYYIGSTALISFMMRVDADVVVMTMPDLETFHIKRSLVRPDIEYIYLDHSMASFHLVFREHAFDNFDTIFCYGPNQLQEIRRLEELHELPEKQLVKTGFGLLDSLLESVEALPATDNDPKIALVAPSWQVANLMELCLPETVNPLLDAGFKVIVRPHPEFIKRFPERLNAIIGRFEEERSEALTQGLLVFERDFSSNATIYTSDVVITDWSAIAFEYSFSTKKPSVFINTPMKVMNPHWEQVGLEPLEISLRSRIGVALDIEELATIGSVASKLVGDKAVWIERITAVVDETMFDVGNSSEAGGRYILEILEEYKQVSDATE